MVSQITVFQPLYLQCHRTWHLVPNVISTAVPLPLLTICHPEKKGDFSLPVKNLLIKKTVSYIELSDAEK